MKIAMLFVAFAMWATCAWSCDDDAHRSPTQRAHFVRDHPCPATGKNSGACPGYVVDHIKALCVGGKDAPTNMQWQTYADSKIKDKTECKK